jgi:uncharacterized protein YggU (UPF0235/DUF167 family)
VARLAVRVTPKGGRDAVDGWARDPEGRPFLKVRVSVPPSEGAANAAVIVLLAKALRRPKSALRIVSGESARLKMVEIDGLDEADLAAAFGTPPATG